MLRLGLLTAGGDCPGLNAAIRAVVRAAVTSGDVEIVGFQNGFAGLVENDARLLGYNDVSGILHRGGTILGTSNRDNPFDYQPGGGSDYNKTGLDRSGDVLRNLEQWSVEGLVVIGGDGSFLLGHRFQELGVPMIGIPKTIDNDLYGTDVTFGFDSALITATEAIDKIHTTAESHHRVMVIEVMGRDAGWIALHSGIAGGGDIILIPELPFEYERIMEKVEDRKEKGRRFSVIVVAEGAHPAGGQPLYQQKGREKRLGGIGYQVTEELEQRTELECRSVVLGHLQRGGSPTPYDRALASRFGVKAIELAREGKFGEMVCLRGLNVQSVPLDDVIGKSKRVEPDNEQIRAAQSLGISFGCSMG